MEAGDALRRLQDREALTFCGSSEPVVQRHERERIGTPVRGDDRRRQLEGIAGTKRMHAKHAFRDLTKPRGRRHFLPGVGNLLEPAEGVGKLPGREAAFPIEAGNRRHALGPRCPPCDHLTILLESSHRSDASSVRCEDRHNR